MTFRAFLATRTDDGVDTAVVDRDDADLPAGEVTIAVEWSGLNFKDAMVVQPGNRVARISPLVPGVDLAGRVLSSDDPSLEEGTGVLVHGYDLGVAHHGGFAEVARVPAGWVVPLPADLEARQAMIVGTAGFTAHLSVRRLREVGIGTDDGPVLVTGASGGVGSMAVAFLSAQGFEVVASTGKDHEHDYLRRLGASEVIGREIAEPDRRVLGPERWGAAVDCVGGRTLAEVLRALRYGGAVAASGLTGGPGLETTVYPFITREIALLGVDSVQTPISVRRQVWADLATHLPRTQIEEIAADEIGLDQLAAALQAQHEGRVRGRVLLQP